jgi:ribosomal protein L39E
VKNITTHHETSNAVASSWLLLAPKFWECRRKFVIYFKCQDQEIFKKDIGEKTNDKFNLESNQVDSACGHHGRTRGRSAVDDEQSGTCKPAWLHQSSSTSPSDFGSQWWPKEKVESHGSYLKSHQLRVKIQSHKQKSLKGVQNAPFWGFFVFRTSKTVKRTPPQRLWSRSKFKEIPQ